MKQNLALCHEDHGYENYMAQNRPITSMVQLSKLIEKSIDSDKVTDKDFRKFIKDLLKRVSK